MVTASVAFVVWFSRYVAAASERRMMRMLERTGLDPEVVRLGATAAIMRDVRSRCVRCPSEALCDRWFAGQVEGDNSFCPNAHIFRELTTTAGPSMLRFWPALKRRIALASAPARPRRG
jgi:hypothetical protein